MFVLVTLLNNFAYGHEIQTFKSRELRVDDETFSADKIVVGEVINIKGKLVSLDDISLLITPSVFDGMIYNLEPNWEILEVNPAKSFNLQPSEVKEFEIKARALKPGVYHLHSEFLVYREYSIDGPGNTIVVFPEHITSYELNIDGEKFNITYILDEPYHLDKIWLDKEQKSLFLSVSSEELTGIKRLSIWIPTKLIQNVISEEGNNVQPLQLMINGKDAQYAEASLLTEEFGRYTLELPPFSKEVSIQLSGTRAIPEFPISLITLATSLTGFVIARYVFRWFN